MAPRGPRAVSVSSTPGTAGVRRVSTAQPAGSSTVRPAVWRTVRGAGVAGSSAASAPAAIATAAMPPVNAAGNAHRAACARGVRRRWAAR